MDALLFSRSRSATNALRLIALSPPRLALWLANFALIVGVLVLWLRAPAESTSFNVPTSAKSLPSALFLLSLGSSLMTSVRADAVEQRQLLCSFAWISVNPGQFVVVALLRIAIGRFASLLFKIFPFAVFFIPHGENELAALRIALNAAILAFSLVLVPVASTLWFPSSRRILIAVGAVLLFAAAAYAAAAAKPFAALSPWAAIDQAFNAAFSGTWSVLIAAVVMLLPLIAIVRAPFDRDAFCTPADAAAIVREDPGAAGEASPGADDGKLIGVWVEIWHLSIGSRKASGAAYIAPLAAALIGAVIAALTRTGGNDYVVLCAFGAANALLIFTAALGANVGAEVQSPLWWTVGCWRERLLLRLALATRQPVISAIAAAASFAGFAFGLAGVLPAIATALILTSLGTAVGAVTHVRFPSSHSGAWFLRLFTLYALVIASLVIPILLIYELPMYLALTLSAIVICIELAVLLTSFATSNPARFMLET